MPFDPTWLLLLGVAALFYFMLVRPQQKRAKEQQKLMEELKPGDRVMTISGIVGTIQHLGEKQIILEISPGVEMTVVKAAVSSQPVDDEFEYAQDGTVADIEPSDDELAAAEPDSSKTDDAQDNSK